MSDGENDTWDAAKAAYESDQAAGRSDPKVHWTQLHGKVQAMYVARAQGLPEPTDE